MKSYRIRSLFLLPLVFTVAILATPRTSLAANPSHSLINGVANSVEAQWSIYNPSGTRIDWYITTYDIRRHTAGSAPTHETFSIVGGAEYDSHNNLIGQAFGIGYGGVTEIDGRFKTASVSRSVPVLGFPGGTMDGYIDELILDLRFLGIGQTRRLEGNFNHSHSPYLNSVVKRADQERSALVDGTVTFGNGFQLNASHLVDARFASSKFVEVENYKSPK